jgi:hypothetical protein
MFNNYKDWTHYSIFFSAEHSQKALKKSYEKLNIEQPEQRSFENCYPFIYYLEHAKTYYDQAHHSPLLIQPILMFYGFANLIKACILTIQPDYPENTSVLAHGVSTRKRKKQQYQFFQDEVKIQKNGLFPFMAEKMFHMKHLEGEKASMEELLRLIPELNELFLNLEGTSIFSNVGFNGEHFLISEKVLDQFHMTESRFREFFQSKSQLSCDFLETQDKHLQLKMGLDKARDIAPLRYHFEDNSFHFPNQKSEILHYPEIMVHYLLLYNLSMIARYETEWWSELVKMMPNRDYPFICTFLKIAQNKGPFLIYQYLLAQLK